MYKQYITQQESCICEMLEENIHWLNGYKAAFKSMYMQIECLKLLHVTVYTSLSYRHLVKNNHSQ